MTLYKNATCYYDLPTTTTTTAAAAKWPTSCLALKKISETTQRNSMELNTITLSSLYDPLQ